MDIYVKMKIFHNRTGVKEGEKMINKIKALPEKVSLAIGFTLILGNLLLVFLLSLLFPINMWIAMIEGGIISGIAILFLLNASDKRRSRIDKKN